MYTLNPILRSTLVGFCTVLMLLPLTTNAQSKSALIGSWDLEIQYGETTLPSWLEVEFSGTKTLIGRYVSFSGSARPIAEVFESDNSFNFSIPPQWSGNQYMHLSGTRDGDRLSGNIITNTGQAVTFIGNVLHR